MIGTLDKVIRMNRLFNSPSGRMVSIMIDHSIARGVLPGLVNIKETIAKIAAGKPDAISMLKGIADTCFEPYGGKSISLILKSSSPTPFDKSYAAILGDVQESVTHGADAIAIGCILGGKEQCRSLEQCSKITKVAAEFGMPVIGHFYPNGENVPVNERENYKNVIYAARAGAEIGVDILKIHHSGKIEELQKIIEAVPAKIVLAGGNSGTNIRHYLQMAHNICEVGGAGVAFGRAVWSFEDPSIFIKAINLIVHNSSTVDEAVEFMEDSLKRKIE